MFACWSINQPQLYAAKSAKPYVWYWLWDNANRGTVARVILEDKYQEEGNATIKKNNLRLKHVCLDQMVDPRLFAR